MEKKMEEKVYKIRSLRKKDRDTLTELIKKLANIKGNESLLK